MVLRDDAPVVEPSPTWRVRVRSESDDIGEMLALVELTRPGPFSVRTVELGGYVGVFDGDRLVAMAGQRLAPPGFREISAVCTHPDFRGRGPRRRAHRGRGSRDPASEASDRSSTTRPTTTPRVGSTRRSLPFRRQVVFAALGAP